jgi:hypothetical protein
MLARQVSKLARRGFTRSEIAELLEVDRGTLRRWEAAYPKFSDTLRTGSQVADDRVERSLYERAVGYSFESEKIFCNKDGVVTRVPYIEHMPPDVTACIFWLKNRRKEVWRDRYEKVVDQAYTPVWHDPTERPEGYSRKRKLNGDGSAQAT